jgi:hypothetical protein
MKHGVERGNGDQQERQLEIYNGGLYLIRYRQTPNASYERPRQHSQYSQKKEQGLAFL